MREWQNEKMQSAGKKAYVTRLRNEGRTGEADKVERGCSMDRFSSQMPDQTLRQIKIVYDVPCTYVPDSRLPWVEKYRPVCLSDLIGPVAPYLRAYGKIKNLPLAMVFYGDYGQGKTAGAQCLIRDYFVDQGVFKPEACFKDIVNCRGWTEEYEGCWSPVLAIDAALYNDIELVRDKVLGFMRVKSFWNSSAARLKKFVLFDEADRLNYAAQGGLRTLIEKYPGTVTIYTTNRVESVDPAIRSRASGAVFNFKKAEKDEIVKHLQDILVKEGRTLRRETLEEIAVSSESVRDAVGKLQLEVIVEE